MRSNLVERVYLVCCLVAGAWGAAGRRATSRVATPTHPAPPPAAPVPPTASTHHPHALQSKGEGRWEAEQPSQHATRTRPRCVPCQVLAAAGSEAL